MALKFNPKPFNLRAKKCRTKIRMIIIITKLLRQILRFPRMTSCVFDKCGNNHIKTELLSATKKYEAKNRRKGKKKGMLLRLDGESIKALVPRDVRSSQQPNNSEPARQRTRSTGETPPSQALIISGTFIIYLFTTLKINHGCITLAVSFQGK